jgi:release factor glutamine methyltransferase
LKKFLRYIIRNTWQPLLKKYLSKERTYRWQGIRLTIPPEVFHPRFFFSTRFLLNYIRNLELNQKTFLEPGAGSGLISVYAAKQGAVVTATDINPIAVKYLAENSRHNQVNIRILESDLFNNIPACTFDIIAINPPYYKKNPSSPADYAWYCGEQGEYFEKLFSQIGNYMHSGTVALMVLFDGCDMQMIEEMAEKNGYRLQCVLSRQNLLEKNFIFTIEKAENPHEPE